MTKLDNSFFERADVVRVARDLVGRVLVTEFDGIRTSGRIVETEAYNGVVDKASHAYQGRRTNRTEIMYQPGGIAYVYLCYGIHHLFNVVTNTRDIPHAVLIRAIEPMEGIEVMLQRMHKAKPDNSVGRGPGNVSRALGITTLHSGAPLSGNISIWEDDWLPGEIEAGPRIGVDYAAEDAFLPYRFYLRGNPHVSRSKR
nr:DNA-3-methyladenine glycosylase [Flavihumibacter fluvii]